MSNALVTVEFEDGHKLYSQYQGSSDTFYSALFDSPEEAWGHNRHSKEGSEALNRSEKPHKLEPVKVHNSYGGGSTDYKAFACRKTKQLRVHHDWLDYGYGDPYTYEEWIKSCEEEVQK